MNERPHGGMPADDPTDRELTQLYRESAREQPPAHLDAAIGAAARREAGARPLGIAPAAGEVAPPGPALTAAQHGSSPEPSVTAYRGAWQLPAAVAAVVVLSVSVATLIMDGDERLTQAQRRAPPPSADKWGNDAADRGAMLEPPAAASSSASREEPPASPSRDSGVPSATVMSGRQALSSSSAERTERAPEGEGRRDAGATAGRGKALEQSSAARRFEPAAAPGKEAAATDGGGAPAAPAPDAVPLMGSAPSAELAQHALARELDHQPPEHWGEKIVELRRQGKGAEADGLLAAFRRRFPGYAVPAEWMP